MFRDKLSWFKGFVLLLAGGIYPLAFAPFDQSYVAILSLAYLFYCWLPLAPASAFKTGFLFGIGQFFVGISWIYVSLHEFAGAGALPAVLMNGLFASVVALFSGLPGLAAAFSKSAGPSLRLTVVFPASWIFFEWVRTWIFTGFPWLQMGYSQIDTPLALLAPISGVFGVGLVASVIAGLISTFVLAETRQRIGLSVVFAGLCGLIGGLKLLNWTHAIGEPLKATLIQGNIAQEFKWSPEAREQTLQIYADMTRKHWDSAVIVWPETAIPIYYHQLKDSYFAELQAEAIDTKTDVLVGLPVYDFSKQQYYNGIVSIGAHHGVYRKRHLVPFGEYLPMQPVSGFIANILDFPMSDFSAGKDDQPLVYAGGYPFAPSICYEDVFGQESLVFLPQARYLVNITNDAWFADSLAPDQHLQMARMRALETGRYMLRATNNGISAIISATGEVVRVAPQFERLSLTGTIVPMSGSTPYVRFGDYPVVLLCGLVLVVASWFKPSTD